MSPKQEQETKRVHVDHPGQTFIDPPDMGDGWECVFVARKAGVYTTFTYRWTEPEPEPDDGPPVYGVDWNY